jgi:pyruvate,water dikinase
VSPVSDAVDHVFEPPGKGPWELERTHYSRPVSSFAQAPLSEGFVKGFKEGAARYGVLLDHLKPGVLTLVPVQPAGGLRGAGGSMGPPPKPVLMLLTRLHPRDAQGIATSQAAIDGTLWRRNSA